MNADLGNGQDPSPSGSWAESFSRIPAAVLQPFSLSATALVAAVFLGIFVSAVTSVIALVLSLALLIVGLRATPREAVGQLVSGVQQFSPVSDIESDTPVSSTQLTMGHGGSLTAIETVCFLHLYEREGGHVGRTRTFNMDYFVDLMSAALVRDHLDIMSRELVSHIRHMANLDGIGVLAGPKRGNALLIAKVAYELGLTPIFIKERPLFGKWLEGVDGDPGRAIIVDDISSDGELLANCFATLDGAGYEVKDAYVLIDRVEGDSAERLAEHQVTLHPMLRMDDHRIRRLVKDARGGSGRFGDGTTGGG
jgi:orotate phosphoribosyltransferase